MFHLLHRTLLRRVPLDRIQTRFQPFPGSVAVDSAATGVLRAVLQAPGFVHAGLAAGAAAVALMVVTIPAGRFSLRELSLWSISLWGLAAAAAAGVLAALVYACSGRRSRDSDAAAAVMRRAARAAVVRFVAAQFVLIASLLLIACAAVIAFRNTVPGVFAAAAAAGCSAVLVIALCFLDRSRFAALVDLTDGPAAPGGWHAAQLAHVHRLRVKAAVAWDAETARREDRPSIASRLVPAGQAGDGGEARRRRVQLPDFRFLPARAMPREARLRVRGLLPIVALAVPYAAVAAIAAAILTAPPPSGPLPGSGVATLQTGDLPDQGRQGTGGQPGPGSNGQGNAGTGQSGAGNDGQGNTGAGQAGPGDNGQGNAGTGQSDAGNNGQGDAGAGKSDAGSDGQGTARTNGQPNPGSGSPGTAGAGGQPTAGGGTTGDAGGHPGTGAAAGGLGTAGGQPGEGGNGRSTAGGGGRETGGAAANGSGAGRGETSTPKAFVEGRTPPDGPHDGGADIVVSGTGPGSDEGKSGTSAPDSALLRGIRQTPAPLIEWPPPSASPPDRASVPRPYEPRQPLPAWVAPLVPGGGTERP